MSEQPPSPYGGPPQQPGQPPYGGPPQQPPPPGWSGYPSPAPKPPGMSNKAKFWIGVALAIPALFIVGAVTGVAGGIGSAIDPSTGTASGVLVAIVDLLMFVGFIVAIVLERTRFFALGILAGTAILFVLLAGACVVLLAGLSGGFS